jgi:hypothetical protein
MALQEEHLGSYVPGPIIATITGLMRLILLKRPPRLLGSRALDMIALHIHVGRVRVSFTRMVATAATIGPATIKDPVVVAVTPPLKRSPTLALPPLMLALPWES